MTKLALISSLFLGSVALTGCVTPQELPVPTGERAEPTWHGHLSYPLGFRNENDDLEDANAAANIGLFDFDIRPPGSAVGIVAQTLLAYSPDRPASNPALALGEDTLVSQFNFGLRAMLGNETWQPFVGGGVSFVRAAVVDDNGEGFYDDTIDDGTDVGSWLGAGVYFQSEVGFHLGLNAQYLFDTDIRLGGESYDLGGWDFLILLGFHW